ncbi:MAG: phosphoribosyltransferase domain-containing protein [Ruminococcus sp.]|nr:phosphoribosyltransferase domain-containing protein [Ruminococcus sp.]
MYTENDVMRLAKRYNNNKRSYLLVNPLQAKHMPVSPTKAFEMMSELGKILNNTADSPLVIGFAETATAIAAAVAMSFPDNTYYMHTTRENCGSEKVLNFYEEHSHAVEQQIIYKPISRINPERIILIDDEISTGKTIENIVEAMRKEFPSLKNSEFVVGSVINRISSEREQELLSKNIKFVSLVKINGDNFEESVSGINAESPVFPDNLKEYSGKEISPKSDIPNMREGLKVGEMKKELSIFTDESVNYLKNNLENCKKILVLGTEECMIPAIMLGMELEKRFNLQVCTHSTTRSPIGINNSEDYPCRNGFRIESFYESERQTYLYNTDKYDAVIVVTDSKNDIQCEMAFRDIMAVFSDCGKFYLVRG